MGGKPWSQSSSDPAFTTGYSPNINTFGRQRGLGPKNSQHKIRKATQQQPYRTNGRQLLRETPPQPSIAGIQLEANSSSQESLPLWRPQPTMRFGNFPFEPMSSAIQRNESRASTTSNRELYTTARQEHSVAGYSSQAPLDYLGGSDFSFDVNGESPQYPQRPENNVDRPFSFQNYINYQPQRRHTSDDNLYDSRLQQSHVAGLIQQEDRRVLPTGQSSAIEAFLDQSDGILVRSMHGPFLFRNQGELQMFLRNQQLLRGLVSHPVPALSAQGLDGTLIPLEIAIQDVPQISLDHTTSPMPHAQAPFTAPEHKQSFTYADPETFGSDALDNEPGDEPVTVDGHVSTNTENKRRTVVRNMYKFEGYPPAKATVPGDASLFRICQEYPNSLNGEILNAFLQRHWSGAEIFACLPRELREDIEKTKRRDPDNWLRKRLSVQEKLLRSTGRWDALIEDRDKRTYLKEDGRPANLLNPRQKSSTFSNMTRNGQLGYGLMKFGKRTGHGKQVGP